MKKALLIIAVIAVLSGCGTNETLTCTSTNTVGNMTSNTKYMIEYNGNDVKMLTVTYDYRDRHVDGVGTGTDGTTDDDATDTDDDGIVDGVVGEALDDVVSGIANGILDIAGIRTRHDARFGSYANTEGFTTTIDSDNDMDYKVTYTYDLDKLSDTDITTFGISRDFKTLRNGYTDRGMTCK